VLKYEPDGDITHEKDRIILAFTNQTDLALEKLDPVRTSREDEERSLQQEHHSQMITHSN
jgi:hypothetical protein